MTNAYAATFNVADGSFTFFSKLSWLKEVQNLRQLLINDGMDEDVVADMDEHEVFECVEGDEVFIEFIPEAVK